MKESVFDRPVFIVSAPRAGSTLLYEMLSQSRDFWTIGGESHAVIEGIPALRITKANFKSNALSGNDASSEVVEELKLRFTAELRDSDGIRYGESAPNAIRFLEKTPKNSLRIDFIQAVFPDALFIYLIRDAKENISSIMEAWRSKRFITYPSLPGWGDWSLLLPDNWRQFVGKPLVDVAAFQWQSANAAIINSLSSLAPERYLVLHYEELVKNTAEVAQRLTHFCQISEDDLLKKVCNRPLALSRYTLTPPKGDKWRSNHSDLALVWSDVRATILKINQICQSRNAPLLDAYLPDVELAVSDINRLPRNSSCPCGSGKRVKHCHGNLQNG